MRLETLVHIPFIHSIFLKNMGILEFLLFIFLIFPIVHSLNVCSSSLCGNIQIKYPFRLQDQEPGNNCTYINLTCSNQGISILNLPFSGDVYVNDINYDDNEITLHDPGNCLPGRLLNNSINLKSLPYTATYYENYTFYACPANSEPVGFYASLRMPQLLAPKNHHMNLNILVARSLAVPFS